VSCANDAERLTGDVTGVVVSSGTGGSVVGGVNGRDVKLPDPVTDRAPSIWIRAVPMELPAAERDHDICDS
jgi:hypothetical protein